jgi:hypothetical protein
MERIVFSSIPKCGTHLLKRYFAPCGFRNAGPHKTLMDDPSFVEYLKIMEAGTFSPWHYKPVEPVLRVVRDRGLKVVFLYRDPRSQLVSNLHYILCTPYHPLHTFFTKHLETTTQRLKSLILGIERSKDALYRPLGIPENNWPIPSGGRPYGMGIEGMYDSFEGWLHEPACFCVRFEDIVGARGGGSDAKQLEIVTALMRFTGIGLDHQGEAPQASAVAKTLFNSSASTFRKGVINSWKQEFDEQTYKAFTEIFGDRLRLWGYDS